MGERITEEGRTHEVKEERNQRGSAAARFSKWLLAAGAAAAIYGCGEAAENVIEIPPKNTAGAAGHSQDSGDHDSSSGGSGGLGGSGGTAGADLDASDDVLDGAAGGDIDGGDSGDAFADADLDGGDGSADGDLDGSIDGDLDSSSDSALDGDLDADNDGSLTDADNDALNDGSADGATDSALDADLDGGADADLDASSDSSVDGSVDGGLDSGVDADLDADIDGSADAALDGDLDADLDGASDSSSDSGACVPLDLPCVEQQISANMSIGDYLTLGGGDLRLTLGDTSAGNPDQAYVLLGDNCAPWGGISIDDGVTQPLLTGSEQIDVTPSGIVTTNPKSAVLTVRTYCTDGGVVDGGADGGILDGGLDSGLDGGDASSDSGTCVPLSSACVAQSVQGSIFTGQYLASGDHRLLLNDTFMSGGFSATDTEITDSCGNVLLPMPDVQEGAVINFTVGDRTLRIRSVNVDVNDPKNAEFEMQTTCNVTDGGSDASLDGSADSGYDSGYESGGDVTYSPYCTGAFPVSVANTKIKRGEVAQFGGYGFIYEDQQYTDNGIYLSVICLSDGLFVGYMDFVHDLADQPYERPPPAENTSLNVHLNYGTYSYGSVNITVETH